MKVRTPKEMGLLHDGLLPYICSRNCHWQQWLQNI